MDIGDDLLRWPDVDIGGESGVYVSCFVDSIRTSRARSIADLICDSQASISSAIMLKTAVQSSIAEGVLKLTIII